MQIVRTAKTGFIRAWVMSERFNIDVEDTQALKSGAVIEVNDQIGAAMVEAHVADRVADDREDGEHGVDRE